MKYIAKVQIAHKGNGRTYEPGEVVPLDHITDEQRALLVDRGFVTTTESDAEVSEIETLRGMSAKTATALAEQNIRTFAELQAANADEIVARVDGVTAKQFRAWQTAAQKAQSAD